jgi:hypothetical protein
LVSRPIVAPMFRWQAKNFSRAKDYHQWAR